MDATKALEFIPAQVRQIIYVVLIIASLLLTATGAVFLASPYAVPWWVGAGLAGLGVLAAPFGVLAASNMKTPDDAIPGEAEDLGDVDSDLPVTPAREPDGYDGDGNPFWHSSTVDASSQ